jgi:hypothetical protein
MTEDDTVAALRRISLDEIDELWQAARHIPSPAGAEDSTWTINDPVPMEVDRFFRKHGWSYKQYLDAAHPASNYPDARWRSKK